MTDAMVKAANAALVESMVQQLHDCVSVGDEMTLDHASLINDAADWIAGEPARLAAAKTEAAEQAWDEAVKATDLEQAHVRLRAVAAAREEQRETDVRSCPTCKGVGFTMRVRECPFCDDSTHDHECPTDEVKAYCVCGAARIRAAPLTATPLAERIAELERERDEWKRKALVDKWGLASTLWSEWYAELSEANQKHMRERDAALVRVKELESEAKALRHDADAEWGASATERETLRAERDRAVAALVGAEKTEALLAEAVEVEVVRFVDEQVSGSEREPDDVLANIGRHSARPRLPREGEAVSDKTITIRMRDLVPYKHGALVQFEGREEPSLVGIVSLRWCEDGRRMSAMLDSHNFIIEEPDVELDYMVEMEGLSDFERERIAAWVPPAPPAPRVRCPHCGQEVKP